MDEKNRKPQVDTIRAAGTPAAKKDVLSKMENETIFNERKYLIELIQTLTPEQVQQVISLAGELLPPR